MGLIPNNPIEEIKADKVFIGPSKNSRVEDFRSAAKIALAAAPDAPGVHTMIVPGSDVIKQHVEVEGLGVIFLEMIHLMFVFAETNFGFYYYIMSASDVGNRIGGGKAMLRK